MQLLMLNVCRPQACDFAGVKPEIDIWRAATLMLKRYGEKALEQSTMRANDLAADGDHDGADTWRRITVAVSSSRIKSRPDRCTDRTGPETVATPLLATRFILITDLFDSAAATARGSLSLGARPMKRRRWRSPPR